MTEGSAPVASTRRSCPKCPRSPRMDVLIQNGVEIDHCHLCGGVFLDANEMQKITSEPPREWAPVSAIGRHPKSVACPACHYRLVEREYGRQSGVYLDHCDHCGGIFLEAAHVRLIRFQSRASARWVEDQQGPSPRARLLAFVTGLPVEVGNPLRRRPTVVYALIAINILAFLLELSQSAHIKELLDTFALVPAVAFEPDQWYRFVTAMFLHGGVIHLAGNLYFLWLFGDNVEDQFGHASFLLLYLVWGIVASIVDAAIAHGSTQPRLGASGAISGVLGAYVILRPRARLFFTVFFVIPVRVGATAFLLFWVALQCLSGALQLKGVAWWAHVAGFVAGIATTAWARRRHVVEALPD